MEFLKKIKWNTILVSAVAALLGLIIISNPEAAALSICSLVGWFLAIGGGLTLFAYLMSVDKPTYILALALIQLIPGAYIAIKPDILVNFVSLLLGIVLLIYSIACLRESVESKRQNYRHWWFTMLVGIFTLLLAICVIINPFETGSAVMIFAGISLLVHGLANIISVIIISNDIRKMM